MQVTNRTMVLSSGGTSSVRLPVGGPHSFEVFAGFDFDVTDLPGLAVADEVVAHFNSTSPAAQILIRPGSTAGTFALGVRNGTTGAATFINRDYLRNRLYRAVLRWNVGTRTATLFVDDPFLVGQTSPNTVNNGLHSGTPDVADLAFRQTFGMGRIEVPT